jgi:hypothetical protein
MARSVLAKDCDCVCVILKVEKEQLLLRCKVLCCWGQVRNYVDCTFAPAFSLNPSADGGQQLNEGPETVREFRMARKEAALATRCPFSAEETPTSDSHLYSAKQPMFSF